jgi:polyhydroxybutyrate depolymerase
LLERVRRRAVTAAGLVLLGSVWVAATVIGTGSAAAGTASDVPPSPSPGCAAGAAPSSGSTTLLLSVAGRDRLVIVHLPAGYAGHPTPLVLNLHGSQSTAAAQEAFSGMDATADADGFIVAFPQGDIPSGGGFEWNVPGQPLFGGASVPAGAPDDVSFLQDVVSVLGADYCVDRHRVYATGFSGGARMASQLGCDASSVFAAVAPVSGLRLPTPCPSPRPVPVLSFHGTADPVDPYQGNGQEYWTYSVPTAAKRWAVHDRCSSKAGVSRPDRGVTVTTYRSCADGATVELVTIVGEGHEWPGGPHLARPITRLLGPQSNAVDADTVMWSFFVAHPLP